MHSALGTGRKLDIVELRILEDPVVMSVVGMGTRMNSSSAGVGKNLVDLQKWPMQLEKCAEKIFHDFVDVLD